MCIRPYVNMEGMRKLKQEKDKPCGQGLTVESDAYTARTGGGMRVQS